MKKIIILVTNEVLRDPRVFRSATTAAESGYDVRVICLSEEKIHSEVKGKIKINRIREKGAILARVMFLYRMLKDLLNRKTMARPESVPGSETGTKKNTGGLLSAIKDTKILLVILLRNTKLFFGSLKYKADIYHSHDLDTLLAGVLLAKLRGGKLIYDSHELYNEQFSDFSHFLRKALQLMEGILIKHTNSVITVNESIASILSQRYGITVPAVVMNCPAYEPRTKARQKSNQPVKAIYIGAYYVERGLEELILSAKYIIGARIYLRGYGLLEPKLRKMAEEEGIKGKVVFLRPVKVNDIVKSLAGYDIGIIPYKPVSLNNMLSTPNKLFEYMMAGLAVAASDMPELRKILVTNNAGRVFDSTNPRDIAKKIDEMASDKRLPEMKQNAAKCAKATYNWENQSKKLLEIYNSL